MKTIDANLPCPSCSQPLTPVALACGDCGLKVEGSFALNEFARISPEDLHFLRIFIQCEGRIRDMESALGLSYPTIRARLTAFKERMVTPAIVPPASPAQPLPPQAASAEATTTAAVLEQLQSGTLSYEEALKRIKRLADAGTEKRKGK